MSKPGSSPRFRFTGAALLLTVLVFLLPAVRDGDHRLYLMAVLVPAVMLVCATLFARMFSLDRMLLSLSLWLFSAGIAAFAVTDPDAALAHALRGAAGLAALLAGGVLIRSLPSSMLTSVGFSFIGLLLLAGKLLTADFTLPVEQIAVALLLIAFSSLLSSRGALFALLPGIAAAALLMLRGDFTGSVCWGLTVLLLLFAADGRLIIVLPALALLLLAVIGVPGLFPLQTEEPSVRPLSVLLSAGAVGADTLPEALLEGDSVPLFFRLAAHYGFIFAGLTSMLFLPLLLRSASVASAARTRFHAVLVMGVTLLLVLRTIAAFLSLFGFLPFPSGDIPFLTSSLPDLCAQFFLIGLACGVSGRNEADLAEDAHLAMLAK